MGAVFRTRGSAGGVLVPALLGTLLLLAVAGSRAPLLASSQQAESFEALGLQYDREVRPLIGQFCQGCHSTALRTGELDLERFTTLAEVRRDTGAWLKVVEMLEQGEMPPEGSGQPRPEQRQILLEWAKRYLRAESLANAGDPGPVVLRRLNNAEYTYTIRDLTGVALHPTREFPTDSAAGEGFTNAGNALIMSPGLLQKYLDAGKTIAQNAVLLPDGFRFSPQRTRRDWTDEILAEIRQFYGRFVEVRKLGVGSEVGNVNVHGNIRIGLAGVLPLQEYFAAALAEREALRSGRKTVPDVAGQYGLNARYLARLWTSLNGVAPSPLLDDLRARWRSAGPSDAGALASAVGAWQQALWMFGPVGLIGRTGGPKRWMEPVDPLVFQQFLCATIPPRPPDRRDGEVLVSLVVTDAGDGNDNDLVVLERPRLVRVGRPDVLLREVRGLSRGMSGTETGQASPEDTEWGLDPAMFGRHPNGKAIDADSLVVRAPAVIPIRLPASLAAGRDLIARAVLDEETGREGSVQVELVLGEPAETSGLLTSRTNVLYSSVSQVFSDRRDLSFSRPILVAEAGGARRRIQAALDEYRSLFPAALCFNQIVPVDEILTLQLFYREDDHLARLMLDSRQRARLDRLWEELRFVSQSPFQRVTALDLLLEAMVGNGRKDRSQYLAMLPLQEPFNREAAAFRHELIDAESQQLAALVDFADRAYRRPLTDREVEELHGLYRSLRQQELSHEVAFRLTLARVFVASPFLYRLEKAPPEATAEVSDWELASRLSYFLWSSQPDRELRALAAQGGLRSPEVLVWQARRMLADGRVRRLATEFACQWLHIYDFDQTEEKSEKYFPEFADIRGDMYEESIRFFTDLFQGDASLLSLFNADHTFVNQRLAEFYGIEGVWGEDWQRIQVAQEHGRGGILALATTLSKQSGASRTSPILRGNWISEVLLGEKLPRPPQDVPELPPDETATEGLTLRQVVALHTSEPSCASCHRRIDPFGFALEGFDAIGRRRQRDMAGRPLDTRTTLPDGNEIQGLAGLRDYLLEHRREEVLRQFCRKLLGYAIGRELKLSDQPLVSEMLQRLARSDYRFSVAIETIVGSRQFREIRGRDLRLAGDAGIRSPGHGPR